MMSWVRPLDDGSGVEAVRTGPRGEGLAVRHMPCLAPGVAECADHIAKGEEAHVDLLALFESLARGSGLLLALRARKIHEVELGAQAHGQARCVGARVVQEEREHGVRAA